MEMSSSPSPQKKTSGLGRKFCILKMIFLLHSALEYLILIGQLVVLLANVSVSADFFLRY